jgi:lipopolysaccharide export system permease protein
MFKIKLYLFKTTSKYILYNLLVILFLVTFLNFIELSRAIDNQNKNFYNFIILSFLKIPSIINETSPFVIIVSTAFIFRYLINNNELISMRNIGFSIFEIFQPIVYSIFIYGLINLFILNPLSTIFEIKYNEILDNKNDNMYTININNNTLWIKNKIPEKGIQYINIEEFDVQNMYAEKIKILIVNDLERNFISSKSGLIKNKIFYLEDVNFFNLYTDEYIFKKNLNLNLYFTKNNILDSLINFKNIPYYNYIKHTNTLKKFNLYSSEVGLYYISEILKPFFIIALSFVVMGFSAKFKRNENFFRVLFTAVLIGFIFFFLKELINKFTINFSVHYIFSYCIIFLFPFLLGLYKVIQIEND